ncbi:hypothetical protein ABZX98_25800 [Streptomyces sp. NPDC002992]|uniref:hypothetical protein n=1 Tax=Streptomyces sp. NPDC002992 TaxID=3154273 RepID=UPI0033B06A07
MPSPSPLAEPWMRGVAANAAAPSDVLIRLLDPAGRAAWQTLCEGRGLPGDVVDAVIRHPDLVVRRAFARNPHVDPPQRGRMVRGPSAWVRGNLAGGPHPRPRRAKPLPDDILEALLTARDSSHDGFLTDAEIVQELEFSRQISRSFRHRMPEHENPVLRAIGTGMWHALRPAQRAALLDDPDPDVRDAALARNRELDPAAMEADLPERDGHYRLMLLMHFAVSRAVVEACLADRRNVSALAYNPHTPPDAVERLARDPDPEVRAVVAARADLDASLLAELAEDPDETVRTRARVHPLPRTWAQRGAIDQVIGHHTERCLCPISEPSDEPDADWYRACAMSEQAVLRRVAASYPALPEDLVKRLADDADPEVRHRLACYHPLAPPALLLDTFLARPRQRPHLLTLPQLPRTGLRHLLGHDDPEVRALAAADTTLEQAPVQLLTDPDERVRRVAAASPLLPEEMLAALLDDPATAEGAAANPNLPAARLHDLLDRAGVPGRGAASDRRPERRPGR